MPTRIPTEEDFRPILPSHPCFPKGIVSDSSSGNGSGGGSGTASGDGIVSLAYPTPRESTTAILLLFHGLGDSERPFAGFARAMALPGVLAVAVRGVSPLPAGVFSSSSSSSSPSPSSPFAGSPSASGRAADGDGSDRVGYHWGDDLRFATSGGGGEGAELDPDPGFDKARRWVMDQLIGEVLVRKCGWEPEDILLFGYGQGGGLALGLASLLRVGPRVEEVGGGVQERRSGAGAGRRFKGVVSIGGALPPSMVPSVSGLGRAKTPALVCCGRESEAVDEDAVDLLEREFETVRVVRWKRASDGMPTNREEALPMMQFFAERLRSGWL